MKRFIATLVILAFWTTQVLATTYYVSTTGNNGNDGLTTGTALAGISYAVANKAGPNDTIIVRNGTYVEPNIDVTVDGLTIQAENPGTLGTPSSYLAIISSASNFISGPNTFCNPAISSHANNLTVRGLKFTTDATNVTCPSLSSGDAAIRGWTTNNALQDPWISGPQVSPYVGLHVDNVYVDSTYMSRVGGIKTNQDNTIIENSEVHTQIECFNGVNQVIRNNRVYDGTVQGVYIACKGGARNAMIYGNIVHLTQAGYVATGNFINNGILIGGQGGSYWDPLGNGYNCYNCVAFDNVVLNESASVNAPCFGYQAATNSAFFNNVGIGCQIFSQTDGGGPTTHGTSPSRTNNDVNFYNNIFTATGAGGGTQTDIEAGFNGWTFSGALSFNFNIQNGYSGTNLSQANGTSSDPLLINRASDWHIMKNSPALNGGTTITWPKYGGGNYTNIAVDIRGAARPQGTAWEIGVYEVGGWKVWYDESSTVGSTCSQITTPNDSTNPPSFRLAWATSWGCMTSGDTFHIKAGSFQQTFYEGSHPPGGVTAITVPDGLGPTNPTIIEGEGAVGCALAENCTTTIGDGNNIEDPSYVSIRNLRMLSFAANSGQTCLRLASNSPTNTGVVIDNVHFDHCSTHGVFTTSSTNLVTFQNFSIGFPNQVGGQDTNTGGHGMYLEGDDYLLDHFKVHDVSGAISLGIQLFDSSLNQGGTCNRGVIRNGFITNVASQDALLVACPNATVYNMILTNSVRGFTHYGGSSTSVNGCNTGLKFHNNIVYNNTAPGYIGLFGSGCDGLAADLSNNIVMGVFDMQHTFFSSGSKNAGTCGGVCGTGAIVLSAITDCVADTTNFTLKSGTNPCLDAGASVSTRGTPVGVTDIGPFEAPKFSVCSVENGDTLNLRVTYAMWAPPMLPASGETGTTSRKNAVSNTTANGTRVGDTRYDHVLSSAIANGNTIDISTTTTNKTDSANVGGINQPYIQSLTNQSCTNNVGGGVAFAFNQAAYRFNDLRGTEAAPVAKRKLTNGTTESLPIQTFPGGKVRLRIALQCDATGDCPPTGFFPYYSCVTCGTGGVYTQIPDVPVANEDISFCGTGPDPDIPFNSAATTNQLSPTGSFVAGAIVRTSNAIPTIDLPQNGKTELEYCLAWGTSSTVNRTYNIQLRKQGGALIDNYTVTPQVLIQTPAAGRGF